MNKNTVYFTSSHVPKDWEADLTARILETIDKWNDDYRKEFNDEPVKVVSKDKNHLEPFLD